MSGVLIRVDGGHYRQNKLRGTRVIDFTIPDDVQETRARVAAFIDEQVLPAEAEVGTRPYFDIVTELQAKARAAGLGAPSSRPNGAGWA